MTEKCGAVLVIGGGIAGIQSALDLAESGFKVYLVEDSPAIGGTMAQLDKTFPTNDCSLCILSPKLVATGRHPNIELLTLSEVLKVKGNPGNFKVAVSKHPRYIDEEKCVGCGDCTKVCPVSMDNEFDCALVERKAVYIPFPQAVPLKYTVDRNGTPPCQAACPAGVHAQGYIALIALGRLEDALKVHRMQNPLPLICGRVCPHPCENACNRGEVDSPIAIASLKRFMADWELEHKEDDVEPFERTSEKKVAIIGSGPAGLSAAYFLAEMGYSSTIFESLPIAGGMLAVGIPDYRLPKDILKAEIDYIIKKGVEIKLNQIFGTDFGLEDLKKQGYDAVFLGIGAHSSKKLAVEGEDLEGVVPGVEFLRDVNLGKDVKIGKKVAVIGGGDVAIDAVRVAKRLGSEAFILYRRTRAEMPAHDSEIAECETEGTEINYLVQPVKILGNNNVVVGIECLKMELGEVDESGRRRPVPIEGSNFTIDVDCVMPAIGQKPDISCFEGMDLNISKSETLIVDESSFATNIPGVFAAGDAVSGPATVVKAVGAGRKAARAMDAYLRGEKFISEPEVEDIVAFEDLKLQDEVEIQAREHSPELKTSEREGNFNEIVGGLTQEQALSEAKRCLDCGGCSGCYRCIEACEARAFDFGQVEEQVELNVGSIILASGFSSFDAARKSEFGYDQYKNVVTSVEFERILSASGPYSGKVLRPSDRKPLKDLAFIQCVGSRDIQCGNPYCSSVCCMYTIKEAIIAKEHDGNINPHIFFMDIRAFGKEFDDYYIRAEKEVGVEFIRARPASIEEVPESGNLIIRYVEDGDIREREFDMAVLATGMEPATKAREIGERLGIDLNEFGFCKTDAFSPLETSKPGIFVAGSLSSPKDIPDTVSQASGAAAKASGIISSERGTLVTEKEFPEEKDILGEEPRIGVFVCHCGINIGSVVNVPEVMEYARTLPNVVYADENLYTCSQDAQELIKEKIKEHDLNRVVVASCTPRTHEPLFQNTIREAGLNPYLFEMANIRDQCSWVHQKDPEGATRKAKDLVRIIVSKAGLLQSLDKMPLKIKSSALIVGGGLSGMTAALEMSRQGFSAIIVERENELGGQMKRLHNNIAGSDKDVGKILNKLIGEVNSNERIQIYTNSTIKNLSGYVGNFKTLLDCADKEKVIEHGVVIVATGGEEYKPTEYLYVDNENVLTQMELEERMAGKGVGDLGTIVMIQCVGSRTEERPYCSRVCCTQAVKNALALKKSHPNCEIYILYKDIRTYGFSELLYEEAGRLGIRFIRYDDDNLPQVSDEKGLLININEPTIGEEMELRPDLLVLSSATLPNPDNRELAQILKVPLSKDGFFLEAHMKLRPVDFATDGIFLCGLSHSPKFVDEVISQACGAVARAATILSKDTIWAEGMVASVDQEKCIGCKTCEWICPYAAIKVDPEEKKAEVTAVLCKGCGTCGAACPEECITINHFTDEQLAAQVKSFLKEIEA